MAPGALSDGAVRLRPAVPEDLRFLRRFFGVPEVYVHWGASPLPDEEIRAKCLGARSPAVELGWTRVTVDPDVDNAAGVSFWRGVGFRSMDIVDDEHHIVYLVIGEIDEGR